VILADDMGFSDARCYGGDVDTPNLDRLAAGGVRFTQAYSTARCGPSRSCLLTGYYAQQTASDVMTPGNVPSYTKFIPDYLKPLGYRTYHSGKWHMRFATGAGGVGFTTPTPCWTSCVSSHNESPRTRRAAAAKPGEGLLYDGDLRLCGGLPEGARQGMRRIPSSCIWRRMRRIFPLQAPADDIERYKDRFAGGVGRGARGKHARPHGTGGLRVGAARTRDVDALEYAG
jgi:arylsulfatase